MTGDVASVALRTEFGSRIDRMGKVLLPYGEQGEVDLGWVIGPFGSSSVRHAESLVSQKVCEVPSVHCKDLIRAGGRDTLGYATASPPLVMEAGSSELASIGTVELCPSARVVPVDPLATDVDAGSVFS